MEALRRKALDEHDKAALIDIVIRLQDQLQAERAARTIAFDDGQRFEKAQRDAELADRARAAVSKEVGR